MARKGSFFAKVWSFLVFFVIIIILNIVAAIFPSATLKSIVTFLNGNIFLLLFIGVLFFVGELFERLHFPYNLPAPLFSAIGATYVAFFIIKCIEWMDSILGTPLHAIVGSLSYLIYLVVFLGALILGFMKLKKK